MPVLRGKRRDEEFAQFSRLLPPLSLSFSRQEKDEQEKNERQMKKTHGVKKREKSRWDPEPRSQELECLREKGGGEEVSTGYH